MAKVRKQGLKRYKDENGKFLCSCGCGKRPEPPRRTWFSEACVRRHLWKSDPGFVRREIFRRDGGVCAECGFEAEKMQRIAEYGTSYREMREVECLAARLHPGPENTERREAFIERGQNDLKDRQERARQHSKEQGPWNRTWWIADHIVPVHLGGGLCGPDNYQTLCCRCSNRKTAAEATERARVRREEKEKASPQRTLAM